jgi:hypothetical protein
MARYASVNDIMNRAAVEFGLTPIGDPIGSSDDAWVQLRYLFDGAGQELIEIHPWQMLTKQYSLTTQEGDSGTYPLPDDFSAMIDQTGWDRTNNVSIGGPLSSQDWAYLAGRDLVTQSIYASFRLENNELQLYPQPPPAGMNINFEYMSRNWLAQQGDTSLRHDRIQTGSDVCLYEPILAVKFLKVKLMDAKGFDSTAARMEFQRMLESRQGKDEGASVLSAGSDYRGIPYLSPYYNTGDTGYGV